MKKTLTFLSLLLISISCYSQNSGIVAVYSNPLGKEYNGVKYTDYTGEKTSRNALKHKNLVGSLYINDNFLFAKILSKVEIEGKSNLRYDAHNDEKIRYDAYNDQMEVKIEGKTKYLLKPLGLLIQFQESDKTYQVFNSPVTKENEKSFFAVLSKGQNISLLAKEKIKFYMEVHPKTGYEKYVPPTLKRIEDKLFIGYKNYTTTELPKKKKKILKLFSSKAKDVEIFRKKNKLKYKNKEDLIQIFEYYNTL